MTMDCSFVRHNLIAYRESKLPPDVRREIETHLSECESCRKIIAGWEYLERAIEQKKATEPNPFAATRIIRHIENNLDKKEGRKVLVLRPILVTLAALGAIAIGFTIGKSEFNRINGTNENKSQIETLKSDLYIRDFLEEDNTLVINE
jgi:predicted anti-sigma-YlaC factor YlaD